MRGFGIAVDFDETAWNPVKVKGVASALALFLAVYFSGSSASLALDGSNAANPPEKISPETFTSAQQALRAGVDDLQNGDAQSSVRALTYAAEGGELLARWKLGNLYATGDLVPRNDALAYKYFEQLVESYNEDDFDRRDIGAVSNAFVAIGLYSLSGVPDAQIKPDPERALEMFQVAATAFGDPEAQYRLARMFLDGSAGLAKDSKRAARWFALAAEKGHHGAEALLGDLLFRGDGVPRQRARGLGLLTEAANAAKGPQESWVRELQSRDFAAASDDDREISNFYVNTHGKVGDIPHASALRTIKPAVHVPSSGGAVPMVVSAPPPSQ